MNRRTAPTLSRTAAVPLAPTVALAAGTDRPSQRADLVDVTFIKHVADPPLLPRRRRPIATVRASAGNPSSACRRERVMLRVSYPLIALLAGLLTVLYTAANAVAMPAPADPAWPSYIPSHDAPQPVTASSSTALWPYLVVAIAAIIATLAGVAFMQSVRHHRSARLRTT